MCGPQGRRIVDAVARDGHDLPVVHQLPDDPQLVMRGHAGVDGNRFDPVEKFLVGHLLDLASRDHAISRRVDPDHPRDGQGRRRVVARDHDDPDARPAAIAHGLHRLFAGRVDHSLDTRQGQVVLHILVPQLGEVVGRPLVSHGQHAHPLRGEPVRNLQNLFRPQAVALHAGDTEFEDLFGCALDEDVFLVPAPVQGRHVSPV